MDGHTQNIIMNNFHSTPTHATTPQFISWILFLWFRWVFPIPLKFHLLFNFQLQRSNNNKEFNPLRWGSNWTGLLGMACEIRPRVSQPPSRIIASSTFEDVIAIKRLKRSKMMLKIYYSSINQDIKLWINYLRTIIVILFKRFMIFKANKLKKNY